MVGHDHAEETQLVPLAGDAGQGVGLGGGPAAGKVEPVLHQKLLDFVAVGVRQKLRVFIKPLAGLGDGHDLFGELGHAVFGLFGVGRAEVEYQVGNPHVGVGLHVLADLLG